MERKEEGNEKETCVGNLRVARIHCILPDVLFPGVDFITCDNADYDVPTGD